MNKGVRIGIFALLLIVLTSLAVLVLDPLDNGAVARVTRDGEVVYEIELDHVTAHQTYRVEGENGQYNVVLTEKGHVRVVEASCPDQVCVKQGWIADSGLPIVCLPNKVIVEIVGEEGLLDAVTK